MPLPSTAQLKFENSIILEANMAPISLPEKLDAIQRVQKRIVENFTTEESERRCRMASSFSRRTMREI
jgi:hypothetical protein